MGCFSGLSFRSGIEGLGWIPELTGIAEGESSELRGLIMPLSQQKTPQVLQTEPGKGRDVSAGEQSHPPATQGNFTAVNV